MKRRSQPKVRRIKKPSYSDKVRARNIKLQENNSKKTDGGN